MRLAADRIAKSLQRLDFADAPVWQSAQQRLLEQLVQQLGLAEPSSGGSGGGSTGSGTNEPGSSSAGEGLQLAAVAEQAAAALPDLPLEEEGRMYAEPKPKVGAGGCWVLLLLASPLPGVLPMLCPLVPQLLHGLSADTACAHHCLNLALLACSLSSHPCCRQQVSVAKPDNVVDVSDLDPALSRHAPALHWLLLLPSAAAALPALQPAPCPLRLAVVLRPGPRSSLSSPLQACVRQHLQPVLLCGLPYLLYCLPYVYRRREVQQYKFTDDDFEICVICQLEEGVPLEQVPAAGWLGGWMGGWVAAWLPGWLAGCADGLAGWAGCLAVRIGWLAGHCQ